jgi:hypothetical protein
MLPQFSAVPNEIFAEYITRQLVGTFSGVVKTTVTDYVKCEIVRVI